MIFKLKYTLYIILLIITINKSGFCQTFPTAREVWSIPVKLFSGSSGTFSWDSKKIFYIGPYGINYRVLTDTGWSDNIPLGSQVNHVMFKDLPVISPDSKTLYFTGSENWRIYRSKWNDSLNDWGYAEIMTDNNFNIGWGHWEVLNFLDNETMILNVGGSCRISYFNRTTGLWSNPVIYPSWAGEFGVTWGAWVHPKTKKLYLSNRDDLQINYLRDSVYSPRQILNISRWSDSLTIWDNFQVEMKDIHFCLQMESK